MQRVRRRFGNLKSGAASTARLLLTPFGHRAARFHRCLNDQSRLEEGLVVLLPGIDGCTTVSDNIARGLFQAEVPSAVQVHDWRSFPGWNPLHLVTHRRNQLAADRIVSSVLEYQRQYPGRSVHLIGHSAGAGIALFVLMHMPPGTQVETATLLAPAVSRQYEIDAVDHKVRRGIWSFWSRGDLPAVGLGTLLFGTMDRRHRVSAGALGFRRRSSDSPHAGNIHDMNYQYRMARYWNFGGHFGCTNAAFVAEYVAPIVKGCGEHEREEQTSGAEISELCSGF